MKRTLSILGSTGSIGRQTLDVAQACGHKVAALTVNRSVDLAEEQARQFQPELVAVVDEKAALDLKQRLADTSIRVVAGREGLMEAATLPQADTVVTAVVGIAGLEPTLAAIDQGKRIALANKETLVCAGDLVMSRAEEKGAEIVPVDSEHSAIFQCLQGCKDRGEVRRLIITASGGPFFGKSREELAHVTKAQALRHPNWAMGAKITIDSATLMNKGLEFIEAMRLYRMPPEQIQVVVHRESIVHSLVEFTDGAILAQLGTADMRLPIQYALTWPERTPGPATALDLLSCPPLTFAQPDPDTFRCLGLALECAKKGGTSTAILNGANEVAVELFLQEKISFLDIARLVEGALERVQSVPAHTLEDVLEADRAARQAVHDLLI
ncbi:1-deoxy-D-xylulose-5-phosphate reductoisomerase [Pseudoflavonifractor capillosus]|uniref:1-deoxy-D-xylulose-5-phosphate reductoisomerase n=1 Tax=Pseudoflavonifractor capillosus TaxID=106588 RepID=UPI00195B2168|nr:1-deoxy-D-xylulose-5-phosphate reductoisomerase [Pseudoflavonifractor capillosus]MBM6896324.1 1-deoxy-D-xylulose-5-phosphate reductoisomerase [Pseudoflavonifractor capillosus]